MAVPLSAETQPLVLDGPSGVIEAARDVPREIPGGEYRGLVVVGHPHPLFGGSMDNKVVQTLARAFLRLGYVVLRFNFRGVEGSAGAWDEGRGEVDDMAQVLDQGLAWPEVAGKPFVLAGFSFGSYVASQVAQRCAQAGHPAQRLVLVGTAVSRFQVAPVPPDTLVVHGEQDDVVPLADVLDWARPQHMPVVVVPGVGHFFHGSLPLLRDVVMRNWNGGMSSD